MIERLPPFFYYLISTYIRKTGYCRLFTSVDVYFPQHITSHCRFSPYIRIFNFWVDNNLNRGSSIDNRVILEKLKHIKNSHINGGYHFIFNKPFTLNIWLK